MRFLSRDIPPTSTYKDLTIIRGDQVKGGLKRPVIQKLLEGILNETIVYPADLNGSAWQALVLASQAIGKKVHLLIAESDEQNLHKLKNTTNVTYEVVSRTRAQIELSLHGQTWAQENNAYFMPIGFATAEFEETLGLYFKEIWDTHALPEDGEVWHAAGSGTTVRSLRSTFPQMKIGIANLGFPQLDIGTDTVQIFNLSAKSESIPPFPSNPNYDSRMWPKILEHASPGAIVINYAC